VCHSGQQKIRFTQSQSVEDMINDTRCAAIAMRVNKGDEFFVSFFNLSTVTRQIIFKVLTILTRKKLC
jgi:hypothetical protein